MRHHLSRSRPPGFTLIEMCVVLAVLVLLSGVAAVALEGALRLQKSSAVNLDRMSAWRALADEFRSDVAQATAAPERWGDDVAGPTCLILARGKDHYVVYRAEEERLVHAEEERLVRLESAGGSTRRRVVARRHGLAAIEFERADGGRLVTLRLFTVGADGRRRQSAVFAAALGGDLQ